ncbi:MAG: hypothetical protein JST85_21285 [Acidobacteria bacterium]|nr:hypothetical protein [Acidobacteriota bacterium]
MQCPSCRSEIPDNQFYCPVCRASVYSYVPENVRSTGSRVERAGKRLLEVLLFLILVGVGVVLARAIKWKELLGGVLPAATTAPSPKSEHPQTSQADSANKRKAATTPSPKAAEEKSADPSKSVSAESTGEKKGSSANEPKPTPKPATQPTPKSSSNNN